MISNWWIMKKMEKHKKRDHNKAPFSMPPSKLKRCYTEMVSMNDEERVEHYLKVREQKFNQMKYYAPKTVNIVRHEIAPVKQVKTGKIISSHSDMKLDKAVHVINENKHHSTTNTSKSNDRLVIELKDYLTLTKTKNIAKFKLKPISNKPELSSSVNDIIKTANTVQFNQILNYGQPYEESQRTFLLVPQNKADTVSKESKEVKEHRKQVNRKKSKIVLSSELNSPVETLQKIEQSNHKKSSIQLSKAQKDSTKIVCVKKIDTKYLEPKAQLPEKKSRPVIRVSKKGQRNNIHSNTDVTKQVAKGKKKVILRSHPYFSQHKPFVIKHRPAVTNSTKHQNHSVINQHENLKIDLDSVLKNNDLIDEIKFEVPEHELNFMMSQESESIDQIFPVALKSTDSDDFEYLGFETNDEISTESEMQILGI